MTGVFISYRREDSEGYAGRLYDQLVKTLGDSKCFMDVDGIAAGEDFGKVIKNTLALCDVVLVLIGPRWLSSRNESGLPRIMDPSDWVRIEISLALDRGLHIVPVLVGGASLPATSDLPSDLQRLLLHHAFELRQQGFREAAEKLGHQLRSELQRRAKERLSADKREALERYRSARTILRPWQYPAWTLLIVAAMLVSMAWSLFAAPSIVRGQKLVRAGNRALEVKNLQEAGDLFHQALAADRDSRDAILGLAQTKYASGSSRDRDDAYNLLAGRVLAESEWRRIAPYLSTDDLERLLTNKYEAYKNVNQRQN